MELYDASAAGSTGSTDAPPSLLGAQSRDAENRLTAALDRVADLVARAEERDAAEGLDPDLVAVLEEITADPDAPLELRSIGRRVREGFTTWAEVWRDGSDPAARRLVMEAQRVVVRRATEARAAAAEAERAEREDRYGPE